MVKVNAAGVCLPVRKILTAVHFYKSVAQDTVSRTVDLDVNSVNVKTGDNVYRPPAEQILYAYITHTTVI